MAKNFFSDVGTAIFKPVGDFISSGVTALQPGRVQQMQLERKRIQSLLNSEEGRRFLMVAQKKMYDARTAAMDRGEGYYGGRSTKTADPRIDQITALVNAADKAYITDEKLSESLNRQAQYLTDEIEGDRTRRDPKADIERRVKASGQPDMTLMGFGKPGDYFTETEPAGEVPTSKSAAEYFQQGERDSRLEGQLPRKPNEGMFDRLDEGSSPADFLAPQAPRTYEQIGITGVDDMATLDEMQKALPEIDMREQYEDDPENMQRLMELWRKKKVTKKNLHKAFSALQQRARESLGIA